MNVTYKDYAYTNAVKAIRSLGCTIIQTIPINKGRYKIICTNKNNFLYIFKQTPFRTFRNIGHENTVGETINKTDFEIAVKRRCDYIIRTSKSGNVIIATMIDFYHNKTEWLCSEGKKVFSCPISVFKSFNEVTI